MKIYKKIFYISFPLLTFSCDPNSENGEDDNAELSKIEKITQQRTPQEPTKPTPSGKTLPPPTKNNLPKNPSTKRKRPAPPKQPPYVKPTKDEVQIDEIVKNIFSLPQDFVDQLKQNIGDEKAVKNRIVERKILETLRPYVPYEGAELFINLISFVSCVYDEDGFKEFKTKFLTKMEVLMK